MDYEAYRKWLKRTRGDGLIAKYIRATEAYEAYLAETGKSIEEAAPDDFYAYEAAFDTEGGRRTFPHWYLHVLYRYLENDEMADAILRASAEKPTPAELKLFRMTPLSLRRALEEHGIRTNLELLRAARTASDREDLAQRTGTPMEELVALIKMADLRRMLGVSRIQRLMTAGADSLEAIARMTPDELYQRVADAHPGKRVNRTDYEYLPYRAQYYPLAIEGL